jgi:phosphohistidine swiveling domain-containing protein
MTSEELTWDPPGPGQWYYSAEHLPGPVSTLFAELLPQVAVGWERGAERYGLPPNRGRFGPVGRFLYFSMGSPVLDNPEERERTAAETLATERWRDDLRRWSLETRPVVMATSRALLAEDLGALEVPGLAAHVDRAVAHFLRWAPEHFSLMAVQGCAGGALMDAARGWGLDTAALYEALAGSAASTASGEALFERIAAGLRDAGVHDVVDLEQVRGVGGDVAGALDELALDIGWRTFGTDTTPTLAERPEAVVASIRLALAGPGVRSRPDPSRLAAVRQHVPEVDRDRFDELAAVAQSAYGFNDDNTIVLFSVPLGIVRRAVLEAGSRLVATGRLHEPEDALEATTGELQDLLQHAGPSADELAERSATRRAADAVEPPGAVGEPLPAEAVDLPASVQRLGELHAGWWSAARPNRVTPDRAAATVGTAVVRGRAVVVRDPADALVRLEPGDVLVAATTNAAYNVLFPLVSAVAVEHGGPMGHAAILARELGLTAVIGVPGLLARVGDGDLVEVDPTPGTITVLGRGPST